MMKIPLKLAFTMAMLFSLYGHTATQENPPPATDHPNVLIFLLDDVGFGQLSAFGGPYRTPNLDKVAARGLRYTNFHTTALCSPSRAALLTGRNHHSVGMATITETVSTEPGYNGIIPKTADTLADIMKANHYATYALGKWHLTPVKDVTLTGPFDRWPTHMGFDHWYGFQGADNNQWSPMLWSDTAAIETPKTNGYHLTKDLTDHAIKFVAENAENNKPFFLYFATGAGHAPHHVSKNYIEHNKGRFNQGWDKLREEIFARQKKMGIMPQISKLSPRPDSIQAWDQLSDKEKKLFVRMQEVHAAYIEQTDHEFGRILDALKKSGKLENTLIIVTSDNGASGEGGPVGSINEMRFANGIPESLDDNLKMINKLGGPEAYNHYPAGWALAGNTPFKYWKQFTHEGGVHDPLIISWPDRIKDNGAIRNQFGHMIDIVPTVVEAIGLTLPTEINGITQRPLEGVSMAQTLTDKAALTKKKVQYFEMLGNRGLWNDGWKAVAWHGRLPWEGGPVALQPFDKDKWELYNVNNDPTETQDLAAENPQKLKELQILFDQEAKKYQVYPLNGQGLSERFAQAMSLFTEGKDKFTYEGPEIRIPDAMSPPIRDRSFFIEADVSIPSGGAEGVLIADGGRFCGHTLYIKNRKLVYQYNYAKAALYTILSQEDIPTGPVKIRYDFKKTGPFQGIGMLSVNGKKVAEGKLEKTLMGSVGGFETMDIGSDTATPVTDAYVSPFKFTGQLNNVTFQLQDDVGSSGPLSNYRD